MLEEGNMDPNRKLFQATLEIPRNGVEKTEKGRARENIGFGWSNQGEKKTDQSRVSVSYISENI